MTAAANSSDYVVASSIFILPSLYVDDSCFAEVIPILPCFAVISLMKRELSTSDGGNGNHSVSLPIILVKIKVDQMLPSSYISSLLVSSF